MPTKPDRSTPNDKAAMTVSPRSKKASNTFVPQVTVEPNWAAFGTRPTALVKDCLLLLMGLSREHAKREKICDYPPRSVSAQIYNDLLKATYYSMAGKNPLLKPVDGKVTRVRADLQKVLLSLGYFVTLASSEFSPYRTLTAHELPVEFVKLRPPKHFEWPSAHKVIEKLNATGQLAELKTNNRVVIAPSEMPKGDRYYLRTLGALLCVVEQYAIKTGKKDWLWSDLNHSKIVDEILQLMDRDAAANTEPGLKLPKERALRSHLEQAQAYYRAFITGRA